MRKNIIQKNDLPTKSNVHLCLAIRKSKLIMSVACIEMFSTLKELAYEIVHANHSLKGILILGELLF